MRKELFPSKARATTACTSIAWNIKLSTLFDSVSPILKEVHVLSNSSKVMPISLGLPEPLLAASSYLSICMSLREILKKRLTTFLCSTYVSAMLKNAHKKDSMVFVC